MENNIIGVIIAVVIIAVIVGVIIGVVMAIVSINKNKKSKPINNNTDFNYVSFNELIKNQLVVNELNGPQLTKWFRENDDEQKQTLFFIAKPTQKNATMLGAVDYPAGLDINHSMLQAVVDSNAKVPLKVRLISFQYLADGISQLFNSEGFAILSR